MPQAKLYHISHSYKKKSNIHETVIINFIISCFFFSSLSSLSPFFLFIFCHLLQSLLQVSWVRHRDIHLLTVGRYTYTSDQRFRAIHHPHSEDWILQIKYPQHRDSGIYECQVRWKHILEKSVIKIEDLLGDRAWEDGTEPTNSFICIFFVCVLVFIQFLFICLYMIPWRDGIIYSENIKICRADWRKSIFPNKYKWKWLCYRLVSKNRIDIESATYRPLTNKTTSFGSICDSKL